MIKLNALTLLERNKTTKYQLYNKLNNIRAKKGESLPNISITFQDIDELCEAFDCNVKDLLTRE